MRPALTLALLGTLLLAGAGCAHRPGGKAPRMGPENMPGWHMMNQAKWNEHHRWMLAARAPEECGPVMDEHRQRTQERASSRGATMPVPQHDRCAGMQQNLTDAIIEGSDDECRPDRPGAPDRPVRDRRDRPDEGVQVH